MPLYTLVHWKVSFIQKCPLFRVSFIRGSTVMERYMSNDNFFTPRHLASGTAQGLFGCLKGAIKYMGVNNRETEMIGLGCDGCSASMG